MRGDSRPDAQCERGADFAHHFAAALIDALARAGVRELCICPGSRSTALALAASQRRELRSWSQIDERSAAFFALGIAKATREPVALICTSGTAVANFHPAIVEAYHAHVPLIVLSADRPPELRDWGAGQTIDQVRLYGTHVRWYAELAVPEGDPRLLRYARAVGCRAVAEALGPPRGPVHLNLPFREPLEPTSIGVGRDAADQARAARGGARVVRAASRLKPAQLERIAQLARERERGVIACGPLDADARLCGAIARLAAALGWPILADATSQLRCGEHVAGAPVMGSSDLFLRDPALARALAPEVVLRFGATPVSRSQRLWLEQHLPEQVIAIDPERAWNDPSHLASEFLQVDPLGLCESLLERAGVARRSTL
ncbi:MAG TPA: 2-succinyl-5-enolpyruvyl-6-hydroxy-3-cyclohexene-1-carboxylic-acid synthase, partial [Myxococcota bacterium]|nr:2-succinyl-5-enolpyruvyl-6-hydroxy-3-cyclohexene-1-carboxylic-acid synthase [Myxococcota bacterium]